MHFRPQVPFHQNGPMVKSACLVWGYFYVKRAVLKISKREWENKNIHRCPFCEKGGLVNVFILPFAPLATHRKKNKKKITTQIPKIVCTRETFLFYWLYSYLWWAYPHEKNDLGYVRWDIMYNVMSQVTMTWKIHKILDFFHYLYFELDVASFVCLI